MKTVLITGASSHVGLELLKILPKQDFRTIAGVNSEDQKVSIEGVDETIELNYDSGDSVPNAFKREIDYLFLIPSKSEERALQVKRLVGKGIQVGIKFIVLVSLLDCDARSGILAGQFRYIEQFIESTGCPYTILRSAPLQQNFLDIQKDFMGPVATVSMPIGTGAFAPIHARDIAVVAKNILCNVHTHEGLIYKLTGPEMLTGVEIAGKACRGLNKPVRFVNAVSKNLHNGKSNWARTLDLELYSAIASGFFQSASKDFAKLTGLKGSKLQDFFAQNHDIFDGRPIEAKL